MHVSFENILKEMKRLHGARGEKLFYTWIQKKGYNETYSLSSQDSIEERKIQADTDYELIAAKYKRLFSEIIEKRVDEIYDKSIEIAAKELSLAPIQLIDFNKQNVAKQTLKQNFKIINAELFDAIAKELNLLTTNYSLNGVPISSAKLKRDIKEVFRTKQARLESQVVTETTRVANTAFQYGYKDSGVVVSKQWVAVLDNVTTSICRNGNGEIVDIGQPFSTGDYTAPFHINCRSRIQSVTISKAIQ